MQGEGLSRDLVCKRLSTGCCAVNPSTIVAVIVVLLLIIVIWMDGWMAGRQRPPKPD